MKTCICIIIGKRKINTIKLKNKSLRIKIFL